MPEDRQFRQRLDAWHAELKNQILTPVLPVAFSGCPAHGPFSAAEAEKMPFEPMEPGTGWGGHREYRWFRAAFTLPADCAGKRIVLISGLGGEQLIYLNGNAVGSVDRQHRYVTLYREAPESARGVLLVESYAGNGPRLEGVGPCPPERETVIPPVTAPQCVIGESCLAVFNEDAYQLFMDADTLIRLMEHLPESSLRRQEIGEALRRFTHTADFETPAEERSASYRRAAEALKPALMCRNGSTAPVMHVIGQSHIDLAWLWPLEETSHKAARTYANQLELMEEYPEYRFLACEPALLDILRERHPGLFGRLLQRVQSGQVCPDGAFYAECDANIPSGESLIRQLMWGKAWFRKFFHTESQVAWQPDTFGFPACLPQLLRAFDIPYFATQKLLRADPECERFPWQDFLWEGLDGSRVQAVSFFKNNARTDPDQLLGRWEKDRTQQRHISSMLYPFGYGDGGGGADRDMLEYLRREKDLEGLPRTEWLPLKEHFERTKESASRNVWRGELYLCWHRGTYTVQRKTKTALFELEQKLHDAEFLLAACGEKARNENQTALKTAWKALLIHQFHDVAAGACIRDVHEEAVRALTEQAEILDGLSRSLARTVYGLSDDPGRIYAVNTLSFARRERVTLPGGQTGFVDLPPSGGRSVGAGDIEKPSGKVQAAPCEKGWEIDSGTLRFTLRADGVIEGLTDLRNGLRLQDEGMALNDFRLYKNVEPVYDAWELSREYALDRTDAVRARSVTLTGQGTASLTAAVLLSIGGSDCEETITVDWGSDRIGFDVRIDWRERHKLLKVCFETNIVCDSAIHGVQFGHLERPAHRSTAFARDRYEVCRQNYTALFEAARGTALLSRAVWGISCENGAMALSLLRAPCAPDDTCDRGEQHFAFALKVCDRPFALSRVTEDAYAFAHPPLILPGAGRDLTGVTADNALIETVKPAENGAGTVLRLWEHRGTRAKVTLRLPERMTVCACDFDEGNVRPLVTADTCTFEMRAFEIRTLLIRPGD